MTNTATNKSAPSISETYEEASKYFARAGALDFTLEQLASDLTRKNIDYVVVGGVALRAHGYNRFTNNINLVVTAEGLQNFVTPMPELVPRTLSGYDPIIGSNRRVRSVPHGILIEVMITGEYPGDGKPKPVSIPDPSTASTEINGIRIVTFEKLIELKLASGMTAPHRLKDLADVQELIKIRGLGPEFSEQLDPYVREKFMELYESVRQSPKDERN